MLTVHDVMRFLRDMLAVGNIQPSTRIAFDADWPIDWWIASSIDVKDVSGETTIVIKS